MMGIGAKPANRRPTGPARRAEPMQEVQGGAGSESWERRLPMAELISWVICLVWVLLEPEGKSQRGTSGGHVPKKSTRGGGIGPKVLSSMSSIQIHGYLKDNPLFGGVLANDQLKNPDPKKIYVLNLQNQDEPGSHWVALGIAATSIVTGHHPQQISRHSSITTTSAISKV